MIKDSGDRTAFASGAVRDCQQGKGRCDLMPLDVVAKMIADDTLLNIAEFQRTGNTLWLYNAICTSQLFADQYEMLLELSMHFEEGAKKYGERNWEKGIPAERYIDSAVRHYLKHRRGDTDERHDRAFVWNICCLIYTIEHHLNEKVLTRDLDVESLVC